MHNGLVGVCLEIEDFDLVFCRKLESRTLFSTVLVSIVWRIGLFYMLECVCTTFVRLLRMIICLGSETVIY